MTLLSSHSLGTRAALLKTAEKLFLSQGFDNVSIRQLTRDSGTNVAAVNYHFQGKTNLFREILAKRLKEISQEKIMALSHLAEKKPQATVEEIIRGYIRSFFDSHYASMESDRLMQIIYREMGPDAVASDIVATYLVVPINHAFKELIKKSCPELDDQHVSFCVSSITGQILHFIRGRDILRRLRPPEQNQNFIEDVIEHITTFSLRGLGSNCYA